jgi:hypothetical protein
LAAKNKLRPFLQALPQSIDNRVVDRVDFSSAEGNRGNSLTDLHFDEMHASHLHPTGIVHAASRGLRITEGQSQTTLIRSPRQMRNTGNMNKNGSIEGIPFTRYRSSELSETI